MPNIAADEQSLSMLRDSSQFSWSIIPIFLLILYIYSIEIKQKHWSIVCAALAFWGMDWINEILNALFFHFNQRAPIWGLRGQSSFVFLIGLNIEISLMFAVMGLVAVKLLPKDRRLKILGLPNRWFFAILGSMAAVFVEILLNAAGVLTWQHIWWNSKAPWLIFLLGYLPFFLVAYTVYDRPTHAERCKITAAILSLVITSLLIFGVMLQWI